MFKYISILIPNLFYSYPKPLSNQEHFVEGEHNAAYDHEAFLGEEAQVFDELSPEESRRRLG